MLGGLLRILGGWLFFRVVGVREHAVDVDNLAGRCGFEFMFEAACAALNDGGAGALRQFDAYCFFAAGRACEN